MRHSVNFNLNIYLLFHSINKVFYLYRILQPLLLSRLIRYFDSTSGMSATEAYLYATGVILCSASFAITEHAYSFEMRHLGMQMRVASCSLMFKKVFVHPLYYYHIYMKYLNLRHIRLLCIFTLGIFAKPV